ncbi:hypothetical protein C8J57DRAFT_1711535 [Mycena rebaudengoi]|nr:hypothetical protein C8J57DRAFT_1711535 [Mycena rebaudengoi]
MPRLAHDGTTRPCTQCRRPNVPVTQKLLTCDICREAQRRKKARKKERDAAIQEGRGGSEGFSTAPLLAVMAKQQEELLAGRTSAEQSVTSQRQMRTLLRTVLDERERRIPNSQMRNRDEDGEDDAATVAERIKAEMAAHGLFATAGKRRRGETPESESSDDTQTPKLKKPKNGDVPEETSNPKAAKISSRARLKLQNITLSTTAGSSLKLPSKTPTATS